MTVLYRVSRRDDFVRFGVALNDAVHPIGWTAWVGRRAVGLGGVVVDGPTTAMGHFAASPDYRSAIARGLHRRTLKLLRRIARTRIRSIWATCDFDTPRAAEWMKRLGFRPSTETCGGEPIHLKEFA